MARKYITKYHGIRLVSDKELAKALGISSGAVGLLKNKRKKLLMKIGLTYKKLLDKANGFEYINIKSLNGAVNGRKKRIDNE